MERQKHLAFYPGKYNGCAARLRYNRNIGRLSRQKCFRRYRHYAPKMSVNGASTILGLACGNMKLLCSFIDP